MAAANAFEADVDTKLADVWSRENDARSERESARISLAHSLKIRGEYVRRQRVIRETWDELLLLARIKRPKLMAFEADYVDGAIERRRAADELLAELRAEAKPLEATYAARPWSRFFLVVNSNGHIHSSMSCSTCRPTTVFSWLPTLSGLTERDAVDAHGPLLCSVCFPTAPVEWTVGVEKPVDPDLCPGSGTHDHDSSGLRYYSPRARCNHCGQTTSVTSTHKLRKHKRA